MKDPVQRAQPVVLAAFVAVCMLVFLASSAGVLRLGFPLDDAWIHQTYARNLARLGEWSFVPGEPSGGSTAPLWTLLLTIGYGLRIPHLAWAYVLGGAIWLGLAWSGGRWFARRNPGMPVGAWAVALLIAVEWHLGWAAVSGMETLLFSWLVLLALWAMDEKRAPWLVGAITGIAMWVRPDALTLALPVVVHAMAGAEHRPGPIAKAAATYAIAVGLVALPYFALNAAAAGTAFPSTLYAKTLEYSELQHDPYWLRLFAQLRAPLVGVGIVLVPGLILSAVHGPRSRRTARLAPLAWAVGYLVLFALRLPVVYQHGRYAMPVIPIVIVLSVEGLVLWADLGSTSPMRRIASRVWVITLAMVSAAFVVIGARAYGQDVAIIETEMVDTADWIRANTPAGSLIAAHDIGALGYFADRPILDLAGLTSAEAIPILRNEAGLEAWLDREGATYLMTFPGWYPKLSARGTLVYASAGSYSPAAGGENMAVYAWPAE